MKFTQTQSPKERFLSKVNTDGKIVSHVPGIGQCWDWLGYASPRTNRGQFYFNGKLIFAHCAAWILFMGDIPENSFVLHRCDNPNCCNPSHLFLGTQGDNIKDMQAKGRGVSPPGEGSSNVKLSDLQVIEIREKAEGGMRCSDLAKAFGVSWTAIWQICTRRTWKHLAARDAKIKSR